MILEYIERMRRQPLDVRRQAVRTWTFFIVAGIALIYIVYLALHTVVVAAPTTDPLIAAPYSQN